MPTDNELHLERHTTYSHLSRADAAKMIAANHDIDYASVRGRLSRASRSPSAARMLTELLAKMPQGIPEEVERQYAVIEASRADFEYRQYDEDRLGLFVSDLHMPRHRYDAYELVLTIAQDLRPDVISALNDALDNTSFSRHDDPKPAYQSIWDDSFLNTLKIQAQYHKDLNSVLADEGQLLGLMGNHDIWIFNAWRGRMKETAEFQIAEYMELLYSQGVLMFSRGIHEGHIILSSGLAWKHGKSTAASHTAIARNAFKYFMEGGVAKSVVMGHTHRDAVVQGSEIGYNGVTFINSGHLRHDNPSWMKHKPVQWGMGIVACKYNPMKWESDLELIRFKEIGDKLVARYEGKEYSVPIANQLPRHLG